MLRYLVGLALLLSPAGGAERGGWISLFDGKTLNGWRAEGKADWGVQKGAIIGRQGPNNTSGDLYTKDEWADFELQCDFRIVWPANSGIWFRRSAAQPGYQADILDERNYPDAFSGSLYVMNKGFTAKNSDPKTVKKYAWNKLRISAIGEQILISLNGQVVVKTSDKSFLKPGSIGIQVHPGKNYAPMEVRVRKIRLRPR